MRGDPQFEQLGQLELRDAVLMGRRLPSDGDTGLHVGGSAGIRGLVLRIGAAGLTVVGPDTTAVHTVAWRRVKTLVIGPVTVIDGSPVRSIEVDLDDREVAFLVPATALGGVQLRALESLARRIVKGDRPVEYSPVEYSGPADEQADELRRSEAEHPGFVPPERVPPGSALPPPPPSAHVAMPPRPSDAGASTSSRPPSPRRLRPVRRPAQAQVNAPRRGEDALAEHGAGALDSSLLSPPAVPQARLVGLEEIRSDTAADPATSASVSPAAAPPERASAPPVPPVLPPPPPGASISRMPPAPPEPSGVGTRHRDTGSTGQGSDTLGARTRAEFDTGRPAWPVGTHKAKERKRRSRAVSVVAVGVVLAAVAAGGAIFGLSVTDGGGQALPRAQHPPMPQTRATSGGTGAPSAGSEGGSTAASVSRTVGIAASDFPSGWGSGAAPWPRVATEASNVSVASCLGIPVSQLAILTGDDEPGGPLAEDSGWITTPSGQAAGFESVVEVTSSVGAQVSDLRAFAAAAAAKCLQGWFASLDADHDLIVGAPTVQTLRIAFPSGERSAGFSVSIVTELDGRPTNVNEEIVVLGAGRIEADMLSEALGDPVPASIESEELSSLGRRLLQAASS